MESILYVGMDVHTTNYTLCTYSIETDKEFGSVKFGPDYQNIVRYVNRLKQQYGQDTRVICGYEAGGLGYSLYHSLTERGIECEILAPSTMPKAPNEKPTTGTRPRSPGVWRTTLIAVYMSPTRKTKRSKSISGCGTAPKIMPSS